MIQSTLEVGHEVVGVVVSVWWSLRYSPTLVAAMQWKLVVAVAGHAGLLLFAVVAAVAGHDIDLGRKLVALTCVVGVEALQEVLLNARRLYQHHGNHGNDNQ